MNITNVVDSSKTQLNIHILFAMKENNEHRFWWVILLQNNAQNATDLLIVQY